MNTMKLTSPVSNLMNQDAVQSVVHDLRSPLTVIKGNLQLLLSGLMGQMSDEQMLLLQRSVPPLEDLILMTENLLQSSALENGELQLNLERVDLDAMLRDTIDFYSAAFSQRDMQIYRQGNTFGQVLHVDPFWMKRVLNNLIWNAYKFTPDHGKVFVHVEKNLNGVDVMVEDTGRGIPKDQASKLFKRFIQVSPTVDRKNGSGLGLWICKRILELHGGTINVTSEEGKGSRFTIHIPASQIL